MSTLKGRDFLALADFTGAEIDLLVDTGLLLKKQLKEGSPHDHLRGKSLAMIFEKSSTRTRMAFEVGMYQLGGQALFLSSRDLQIGRGESIADTARVMSRYVDGILIRTYKQSDVVDLAKHAEVPVINGLTDWCHPTQVIADFMTIKEHKGRLEGLKIAYVGDGNNMLHSLYIGGAKVGMSVAAACPVGYEPDASVVKAAQTAGQGAISLTTNPYEAVQDADIIYTDTWASMGQEGEKAERQKAFKDYQVNAALMVKARPDAIFMHCLPAYRGLEVTEEVLEGPSSVVFDEAENRLHAHKAIMASIIN
ncbi:ornithine carbamoyltransferase [Peptococcus simiae]|uniref:ornithine carbamoyltransferase n=1 Tax=Peptococcus simiae TaxID=1643805 RepID=UPI003981259F